MGACFRNPSHWVFCWLLAASPGLLAMDLGVVGPVYPIVERDLLEMIESRLREAEASGSLAKMQRDAQRRAVASLENPVAVPGIRAAKERRTWYFNPSVRAPQDIRDTEGRVLVAAGAVVNPLDTVALSKVLLFFDARSPAQVKRAKFLIAHYEKSRAAVKPILVGGSYLDFQRRHKVRVWYDQGGHLTTRLGITHVPALVTQEGRRLRIDEVPG